MDIVTSAQMKEIEKNSLAHGLTYQRLMENAGSAAAAFIRKTFSVQGLRIMVFCARGNNGGDGFVVARKLAEEGAEVVVVLTEGPPASEEALAMYSMVLLMELPVLKYSDHKDQVLELLAGTDIVVDAICGTGFQGSLRELQRDACKEINGAIAAVVCLDIPTGAECDTGAFDPDAVQADFTVVFDTKKPVHALPSTTALCGVVEVVDIGIPPAAKEGVGTPPAPPQAPEPPAFKAPASSVPFAPEPPPKADGAPTPEAPVERTTGHTVPTIETSHVFAELAPRPAESHKGLYGRLLNLSGSRQYRGAAALSTMAALRTGAGLVTLASTEEACACAAFHIPEATFLPLPQAASGGIEAEGAMPLLAASLSQATAVLFGCGLGDTPHTRRLLEFILENAACPIVIDADGINALAANIHVLSKASAPVILTPHPGEMARLCGSTPQEIGQNRQGAAMDFATKHGVHLVLKGAGTLVALPGGRLLLNQTGNPGLAKGGSGDILAGMIASLLAQGFAPEKAAAFGVHLHGLAADRTASRRSQYAMLPHEILEDLAEIFLAHGR